MGLNQAVLAAAARKVLGHVGGHGIERSGSFYSALLDAMLAADEPNLFNLSLGFPALGWAVHEYKFTMEGYAKLCELAGVPADLDHEIPPPPPFDPDVVAEVCARLCESRRRSLSSSSAPAVMVAANEAEKCAEAIRAGWRDHYWRLAPEAFGVGR